MDYCTCSCGKLLYYDMYSSHNHDQYVGESFFSEKIREIGYRDGFSYGVEIGKRDTIYRDPYDNYIDVNHIMVPNQAIFDPDSYEEAYSIGYERGYHTTFDRHKILFQELNDMLNLRIFRNKLIEKYPAMFDDNILGIVQTMLR